MPQVGAASARRTNLRICQNCMTNVDISPEDLPTNFTASQLTEIKKRGKLIFASHDMFKLIWAAEEAFLSLAKHHGNFLRDAFEGILLILSANKFSLISCTIHMREMITTVIFQYLTLRFRCFGGKKWLLWLKRREPNLTQQWRKKTEKNDRR